MSNRVTDKDISAAIFKPRDASKSTEKETKVIVFTLSGHEDELVDELGNTTDDGYPSLWDTEYDNGSFEKAEESKFAYAKANYGQRGRFFIKQNKAGNLLNPINGMDEFSMGKKTSKNPENNLYRYKEVGQQVFMLYLKFLKTKNQMFLTKAEREIVS